MKHILITRSSRHDDTLTAMAHLKPFAYGQLRVSTISDPRQLAHVPAADAVIIGGGADVSPALYGEENTHSRGVDEDRDAFEMDLALTAIEHGVPLVGICRGMQLINVALGGTLFQDVAAAGGEAHRPWHTLRDVDPAFGEHLPTEVVNSSHHQAVNDLAPGLRPVAWAPDGVVEAFHMPGVLGMQFHPETLAARDPRWIGPFVWMLKGLA